MSRLDNPERHAIAFRSLTPADLPLMHRWRNNPAITTWWEAVPEYPEIVAKYTPAYLRRRPDPSFHRALRRRADRLPPVVPTGRGAGPCSGRHCRRGAAAVDLFIGEDAYRGRGVGAAMLRAFLREIIFAPPDVTTCFIDPDPGNAVANPLVRARRLSARWASCARVPTAIRPG
jgi:aminoglycoside 6'-N-acetyltransferase